MPTLYFWRCEDGPVTKLAATLTPDPTALCTAFPDVDWHPIIDTEGDEISAEAHAAIESKGFAIVKTEPVSRPAND